MLHRTERQSFVYSEASYQCFEPSPTGRPRPVTPPGCHVLGVSVNTFSRVRDLTNVFQLHKVFVFLCERVHNGLRCGSGGGGGGDGAQTGTASKSIGGRRRGSFSVLEQAAGEVDGVTLSRSPHQLYTLLTISCDTLSYAHG